jgi:hypothetical protein
LSTSFCFSRYDATLSTRTTTTLTSGASPVLMQVELPSNGGIAGGGSSAHADTIVRHLKQDVDSFAARIRDANTWAADRAGLPRLTCGYRLAFTV